MFQLTDEEQQALLPSGRQATFTNRVAWAKVYLSQAGALNTPRRGHFQITDRGRDLLKSVSGRISIKDLVRFPEFVEFRTPKQQVENNHRTDEDEGEDRGIAGDRIRKIQKQHCGRTIN